MLHFNTGESPAVEVYKAARRGNDALILTDGGLEQLKEGLEFWIVKTQIVSQCVPGLYCVQPENMTPIA
jgi:hypothetical protein